MNQFPMAELGLQLTTGALSGPPSLDPEELSGAQDALFSSLLGEQMSQISPEVLQAALASMGGEPLPTSGNGLPVEPVQGLSSAVLGEAVPQASVSMVAAPVQQETPRGQADIEPRGSIEQALPEVVTRRSAVAPAPVLLGSHAPSDGPEDSLSPPATPLAPAPIGGEPSSAATRPAAPSVEPPVARPGWDQSLGQRVVWMAEGRQETAEIQLNPPHLGPLKVRVELNGDQASVSFSSNHLVVRDAVESAVPRLREMLEASGLNLANVDVSERGAREWRDGDSEGDRARPDSALEDTHAGPAGRVAPGPTAGIGLVDYYV